MFFHLCGKSLRILNKEKKLYKIVLCNREKRQKVK